MKREREPGEESLEEKEKREKEKVEEREGERAKERKRERERAKRRRDIWKEGGDQCNMTAIGAKMQSITAELGTFGIF